MTSSEPKEDSVIVAFASFYDSPEEGIVDSRNWTEWLHAGWSKDLKDKNYRFLNRSLQDGVGTLLGGKIMVQ